MHTVSSARRTFIACASAVECTATVLIPNSWQARWMRSAISPRLAISTFSNIYRSRLRRTAVFDRRGILDEDMGDPAAARRADLVHHLHRLDDQQGLTLADRAAELDEWG